MFMDIPDNKKENDMFMNIPNNYLTFDIKYFV